jgi:ATP-dependent Clp protease ATP-binding subunit ClpA
MLIYGQDPAIEALSSAIQLSRSGLGNEEKPIGSFLFMGPTGVGKTEVVRQLALQMGIELVRFDMSEYMEQHTVSRLIGAPPGYVGYDQGGLLTEAIIKSPYCVLLLDEIEKAHPDLFNILLQVMDYGTLTDNNGRKADFKHVIVVMTTNVGAVALEKNGIGFTKQDQTTDSMQAMKRVFTPEFRNRLDATIQFQHLTQPVIERVVEKLLMELQVQLETKQVTMHIEPAVTQWLCENGYDKLMGARPMARLIQDSIKKEMAGELLFGDLQGGGEAHVRIKDDAVAIDFIPKKASRANNITTVSEKKEIE